jgi:hypothetical protein
MGWQVSHVKSAIKCKGKKAEYKLLIEDSNMISHHDRIQIIELHNHSGQLTSTGIVSPGKTNTESPTRISSVGTSTHIASEQSTLSAFGSLSEDIITSRD